MRILLESSTESEWVATCLEDLGHEVIVADPNFAAMYGTRTRRIKTDRRDVAALADANRTGVYRPAYRVSPAQRAMRRRLLVRDQLVRMRTRVINLLRSQVRATGQRMATGAADTFGRRFATVDLPAPMREALRPLTDLLEHVAIALREAESWAHQAAAAEPGHPPADDGTRGRAGDRPQLSRHTRSAGPISRRGSDDRVSRLSAAGR